MNTPYLYSKRLLSFFRALILQQNANALILIWYWMESNFCVLDLIRTK